jgi:hypothetical protein
MAYAKGTDVPASASEGEIKKFVLRAGATSFMSGQTGKVAMVAFELEGRRIVFNMPVPDRASDEFVLTPTKKWKRSHEQSDAAWEQAVKERWRALLLCIRAKLESIESGIETFEEAFLAHIQMPDGQTVGDMAKPVIAKAYETGQMQPLLPAPRK